MWHFVKLIFSFVFLPLALWAGKPPDAGRLYEKAQMTPLGVEGWFTMLGTWDEKGTPTILDLSFTSNYNPDSMHLRLSAPDRVKLTRESGKVRDFGASLTQASHGKGRQWFVHTSMEEIYTGFSLHPRGASSVAGKLEMNSPGFPQLKVWEGAEGRIRWEVKEAWQVKVEATVNDAESWIQLGAGNTGEAELKALLPQKPVVRFQAFRGLRCYVDVLVPGQGFLKEPRPYLQPTYFIGTSRFQGGMSTWPRFEFTPQTNPPPGYQGRVKMYLNWKRLPFDPEKLFPGKYVQKVFQAEWTQPSKGPRPGITLQQSLLRDPSRLSHLKLVRIQADGKGGWQKEDLFELLPPQILEDPDVTGSKIIPGGLEANFRYYFVLLAD